MAKAPDYSDQRTLEAALDRYAERDYDEIWELYKNLVPDIVERFNSTYVPPKFVNLNSIRRICGRCGAIVHVGSKKAHKRYHKHLTFALWSLQAAFLSKETE